MRRLIVSVLNSIGGPAEGRHCGGRGGIARCLFAQRAPQTDCRCWRRRLIVQAMIGFAKAFRSRGPNLKVAGPRSRTGSMGYCPDPDNSIRMRVETLLGRRVGRDLPVRREEKAWVDIVNEFRKA